MSPLTAEGTPLPEFRPPRPPRRRTPGRAVVLVAVGVLAAGAVFLAVGAAILFWLGD